MTDDVSSTIDILLVSGPSRSLSVLLVPSGKFNVVTKRLLFIHFSVKINNVEKSIKKSHLKTVRSFKKDNELNE